MVNIHIYKKYFSDIKKKYTKRLECLFIHRRVELEGCTPIPMNHFKLQNCYTNTKVDSMHTKIDNFSDRS